MLKYPQHIQQKWKIWNKELHPFEKSKNQLVVQTTCKHAFQVDCIDIRDGVTGVCVSVHCCLLEFWGHERSAVRGRCALMKDLGVRWNRYSANVLLFHACGERKQLLMHRLQLQFDWLKCTHVSLLIEFDLSTYLTQQKSILYLAELSSIDDLMMKHSSVPEVTKIRRNM